MSNEEKYRHLANVIVAIHIVWTFIILAGAILMFVSPVFAMAEIVVVSFTLLISLPFGAVCPLTMFEERLRRKLDPSYSNHNSYLATYINKMFKTQTTTRTVNITVGIVYALIYFFATYLLINWRG